MLPPLKVKTCNYLKKTLRTTKYTKMKRIFKNKYKLKDKQCKQKHQPFSYFEVFVSAVKPWFENV